MKRKADGRFYIGDPTQIIRTKLIIVVALAIFYSVLPVNAATPWLHTDANKIKDPNGNVVVLRGVDLIDLGSLQEWQGGAINMIDRLTNKSDSQGNSPGWYPRVIRIMITPPDAASGWPHPFSPDNNDLYNLLRSVVNYCKTKDLYAIIDWHYVANTYDHVASTSEFWTYMAPKFANDSHVMFELFNEPINNVGDDTADWLSVRNDIQNWVDLVRSYAPDNLILVAGPSYSQTIGPAASYPLTGDNIVMVSHIYPGHWIGFWGPTNYYKNQVITCAAVYPVFMSEWGFSQNTGYNLLHGEITDYGQPLMDFVEELKISSSAWVASYNWEPMMFNSNWTLRVGEGEMGGFVKDTLYLRKDNDQPGRNGGNSLPTVSVTSPSNGDMFYAGDDIVIEANASDSDGTVTKVEFFQDAAKLGEDTSAPYSYTWTNVPAGRCGLVAKAIDNNGGAKVSSRVNIVVTNGDATGTIQREWWAAITGVSVSNLTSDVNYPTDPNARELITKMEGPINWANNYGTRIRGYLYPPADGNYTFWIASDANSELWLSTDAEPNHISKIAYLVPTGTQGYPGAREWTKYSYQRSSPVSLLAGGKYYIHALHKESTGADHIAVAWDGPGLGKQIIDGVYLSPCFFNFVDFSNFGVQWQKTGCARSNAWCSGADRDRDGNVQLDDLMAFADWWLLE